MVHTGDTESDSHDNAAAVLASEFVLPCGLRLKNRLAKAAMSDSLGDGAGDSTNLQIELYQRWANGGVGLAMIGEVQVDPAYAEKPGNLVLSSHSDARKLSELSSAGSVQSAHLWPQLGHAGALAFGPTSRPAGPSALHLDALRCEALSIDAITELPIAYAAAAKRAHAAGFSGVEVHAGHGFLLSQFLSPLFNRRSDKYGGSIEARTQIILEVVQRIRDAVGPDFAIGVKVNSSDQLEGGLSEEDALVAVELIGREPVDLIEISGGTYFPGAASSSDRRSEGPYFTDFARRARQVTVTPLMLTGGFKTRQQAAAAVADGDADLVGLARAMVVDPELPAAWLGANESSDPQFPNFTMPPPGGVTAWYTMRLGDLARGKEQATIRSVNDALREYEARDASRVDTWNRRFNSTLKES